ncbi:MAG TPA: FMN-binding negative transcriptional regulator [Flavobacterium sp.]|jgi:transcriptional regulator|uniref:FMN-binding negative transcriptional regulator n=1 Tax=Flavobacterium sp. TaxID=239 RepID=UPI001B7BFC4E|nr:FMN-binding negative transcriptional regulator [Flavobacterium sp.]MBP6146707.1 FMN-binding negative transcriptional regulator [Flavobacterium sp.]MBP7182962.1 FMN-binding negative transcriptional regulator [Flavobacterium sp.]MBP7318742.1 FMN-binding negative transcriptional regulator [Flavobacterium sp.]MBP8886693.1 FMN-binding negative transcriptional regulator [Flavobacterium sp.]HRL71179.1 FMN-binding negative transcriptional regulator [Flavobacterium sp.]
MYTPEIYKNENQEEIKKFLQENSFGILINQTNGKLWATHIPLELDTNENGATILSGHISKENPQWNGFIDNDQVLAVFSGPHSYISSSWYDHENVPTWNYIAVHVYGKIKIIEGEAVIESLKKLVDKYEQKSENPVRIEDLSQKIMLQSRGIVAFEIEITEIQATRKMSQNRDEKNYQNIISELEKANTNQSVAVANEMKKCPL